MIYEIQITTTIASTKDNPLKTTIPLTKGIIHQLDIVSYPGSRGTLYLGINHGLHQVYPTNPGSQFRLAGEIFSFKEAYRLLSEPCELDIYTYLVNAGKPHDCVVRIGLLSEIDAMGLILRWQGVEETV